MQNNVDTEWRHEEHDIPKNINSCGALVLVTEMDTTCFQ